METQAKMEKMSQGQRGLLLGSRVGHWSESEKESRIAHLLFQKKGKRMRGGIGPWAAGQKEMFGADETVGIISKTFNLFLK